MRRTSRHPPVGLPGTGMAEGRRRALRAVRAERRRTTGRACSSPGSVGCLCRERRAHCGFGAPVRDGAWCGRPFRPARGSPRCPPPYTPAPRPPGQCNSPKGASNHPVQAPAGACAACSPFRAAVRPAAAHLRRSGSSTTAPGCRRRLCALPRTPPPSQGPPAPAVGLGQAGNAAAARGAGPKR